MVLTISWFEWAQHNLLIRVGNCPNKFLVRVGIVLKKLLVRAGSSINKHLVRVVSNKLLVRLKLFFNCGNCGRVGTLSKLWPLIYVRESTFQKCKII